MAIISEILILNIVLERCPFCYIVIPTSPLFFEFCQFTLVLLESKFSIRQRLQTPLKWSEFGLGVRWVLGGWRGCYAALMRPKKVEMRLQLQIT